MQICRYLARDERLQLPDEAISSARYGPSPEFYLLRQVVPVDLHILPSLSYSAPERTTDREELTYENL